MTRGRAARLEDLDAVVALERVTEGAPHWPREEYERMIVAEPDVVVRRLVVVDGEDKIVGFAVGKVVGRVPDAVGELESVVVAARARRLGIGRALCRSIMEWCVQQGAHAVELEVRGGSAGAQALYRELGFVEVGVRRGYYRDPDDDAVLMNLRDSSFAESLDRKAYPRG